MSATITNSCIKYFLKDIFTKKNYFAKHSKANLISDFHIVTKVGRKIASYKRKDKPIKKYGVENS